MIETVLILTTAKMKTRQTMLINMKNLPTTTAAIAERSLLGYHQHHHLQCGQYAPQKVKVKAKIDLRLTIELFFLHSNTYLRF